MDWEQIAKQSYAGYAQVTDWKNYQGNAMPQWDNLPEQIKQAWIAACKATARALIELKVVKSDILF